MKKFFLTTIAMVAAGILRAEDTPTALVYTRNGLTVEGKKGFVHDNVASCVAAIEKIGKQNGFAVVSSDDPAVFTKEPLKKYRAIIFANSNNKAFDNDEQKKAFQDYIHGGGGFVGIHSATGSERDWPWYWNLIGGTFAWHAPLQKFKIDIVDTKHPATSFFDGRTWDWEDEFYTVKNAPNDLHVLLTGNIKPLRMGEPQKKLAAAMPDAIPLAWYHEFEGGRAFYTALGHKKEYYSDPMLVKHLTGGILWAMKMESAK